MKRPKNLLITLALALGVSLFWVILLLVYSWAYTTAKLRLAHLEGVYLSAEEGMLARIARGYAPPYEVEITYAGTNSFDGGSPHVWYVIACVWAERRSDGSPVGSKTHDYDQPGSFFLDTKDGWVHMSEGAFPGFIGFWMKVYGLAGPGASEPSHPWEGSSRSGCVR